MRGILSCGVTIETRNAYANEMQTEMSGMIIILCNSVSFTVGSNNVCHIYLQVQVISITSEINRMLIFLHSKTLQIIWKFQFNRIFSTSKTLEIILVLWIFDSEYYFFRNFLSKGDFLLFFFVYCCRFCEFLLGAQNKNEII